ncbi:MULTISPECIES: hypothetical protein [Zhihengliuella]|uniref:Multidrug transporter n=1 Tax=Zhihengliuella alba TaxID=547018 RepID=A0ABP7CPI5_9MICC|nr:hypothetical protein [Zhihengliuella sp.]
MAERGSDKHGPELDEEMQHEADGGIKGAKPAHREEFRQSEPFTDDTDPQEVQDAPMREDLTDDDR